MIGPVLALVASLCFAVSNVYMRTGMYRSGESFSPIPISAFLATVFFAIALFASGEAKELSSLSLMGVGSLAGAGVIHFVVGRMLAFASIQLIGANRAASIMTFSTPFAAALGIFFLGEPLTILVILAILLIVGGLTLVSTTGNSKAQRPGMLPRSLAKGVLAGLGAAFCFGVTSPMIKIGLEEASSSLQAVFVSYIAASMLAGALLFHPSNWAKLRRLDRSSMVPIIVAAAVNTIAQALQYAALDHSHVSIVTPITATSTLFVFPFSFLINRQIETFNWRIIIGAIAMVAGVFVIFRAA